MRKIRNFALVFCALTVLAGCLDVNSLLPARFAGEPAAAEPSPITGPAIETKALEPAPEPEIAAPAPVPDPVATVSPKSALQMACEKRHGRWARTPNGAYSCVKITSDHGKTCTKSSDCQGECLARSGSCAPYQPLFGCNEILDAAGRRGTQCLN